MTQETNWYRRFYGAGAIIKALSTALGVVVTGFLLIPAPLAAAPSSDLPTLTHSAPALLLAQAKKDEDDLLEKDDDDDDDDDDKLLKDDDENQEKSAGKDDSVEAKIRSDAGKEHAALFAESRYPSATTCGTCHPRHFEEWAVSQHSYAQLSPAYMALQNFINLQVNGTNGDFCIRCHNQVGMNMEERVQVSNLERHPTSREGITCIVCHRVANIYNKASGRVALVEGDLLQPVYGPAGDKELKRVFPVRIAIWARCKALFLAIMKARPPWWGACRPSRES